MGLLDALKNLIEDTPESKKPKQTNNNKSSDNTAKSNKAELDKVKKDAYTPNGIDPSVSEPQWVLADEEDGTHELMKNLTWARNQLESFKLWAEDALAWYYFSDEKVWNPKLKRYELRTVKKRLTNVQYLIVGRGAAKSMYASFMQMYGLVIDPTTTHQIVTAPTMKQAEAPVPSFLTVYVV